MELNGKMYINHSGDHVDEVIAACPAEHEDMLKAMFTLSADVMCDKLPGEKKKAKLIRRGYAMGLASAIALHIGKEFDKEEMGRPSGLMEELIKLAKDEESLKIFANITADAVLNNKDIIHEDYDAKIIGLDPSKMSDSDRDKLKSALSKLISKL